MTAAPAAGASRPRASRARDTIVAAKIAQPVLPQWVVWRPRIDTRVNDGAQGPLTLVSGPPGSGKTLAIASWAAASAGTLPVAWVTLDEYDNCPKVFWSYLVEALRQVGVEIPRTAWASGRGRAAGHDFIVRLAATIAARCSPVVVVLDDLHLVTDRRTLDGLVELLRNARPYLRVVVASRTDPMLPLHRYRLAGELTEIRAGELAFSTDEASVLMAQHGIALSAESLEFLTARADGWVAALRLAAISMRDHPDPQQFVKEVAAEDGAVAGYLVEEVLNTLHPGGRDLLLRTSILDRVSADLASELVGDEPDTSLPALAQANAFIQPLGGGWYRYHPLLAEVLRLKLRREFGDLVPGLHRAAARWLRRNGTLAEAAQQAAAADDWQLAARIAVDELAIGELIEPPGTEPLAQVLKRMPRGRAWSEPQPWLVTAALGLTSGSGEAVDASLAAADRLLQQIAPDEQIPSRLARALVGLFLARRTGDLRTAQEAADDAAAQVARIPADQLAPHPGVTGQVAAGRGTVELWSGHFDQAAVSLAAAAAAAEHPGQRVDWLGQLALAEALRGRLGRARELALEAIGAGPDDQANVEELCDRAASVALAYVHLERFELAEAHRWLQRADEGLHLHPDKLISAIADLVAARGCLAEDRLSSVADLADRARHGWSPTPWLQQSLTAVEAQAHAADGRAHARTRNVTGDRQRCQRSLEHALRLGAREQLRLPFVLERAWIRGELERSPDLAHGYRQLLDPVPDLRGRTRPVVPAPRRPRAVRSRPAERGQAMPLVVEKLSDREREVLQLVSQMHGTAEIAAELFVSINTVKSHLKSVFRKLGAASRNEAVRRARQLELI